MTKWDGRWWVRRRPSAKVLRWVAQTPIDGKVAVLKWRLKDVDLLKQYALGWIVEWQAKLADGRTRRGLGNWVYVDIDHKGVRMDTLGGLTATEALAAQPAIQAKIDAFMEDVWRKG